MDLANGRGHLAPIGGSHIIGVYEAGIEIAEAGDEVFENPFARDRLDLGAKLAVLFS